MRKLSIILTSFFVTLSLCGAIPTQAEPLNTSYGFLLESFENGDISRVYSYDSEGSVTLVSPGAGESNFGVRHTVTKTDAELTADVSNQAMATGQAMKASSWIRLKSDVTNPTVTYLLCGTNTEGGVSVLEMTAPVTLAKEEWVYTEAKVNWDGFFSDGTQCDLSAPFSVKVRIGSGDPKADTENGTLVYDIDDFCFEPTEKDAKSVGKNIITNGDFSQDKTDWGGVKEIRTDENGKYAYFGSASNAYMQLTRTVELKRNHVYKVSLKVKATDTYNNAGTATDTAGLWIFQRTRAAKEDPVLDLNDYNVRLAGYTFPEFPADGQWHTLSAYWHYEYKTFATGAYETMFRMYTGNQNDACHGNMFLDDVEFIDLGYVANGDFENTDDTVFKFVNPTATVDKGSVVATKQNVLGWTENNAVSALDTDVAPAGGNTSMKVYVQNDGGYVYQGLGLDKADTKYKVSFWAKGKGTGENGVPFSMVLDRSVAQKGGDLESYIVPDFEYYTGYTEKNEEGTFGTWKLTDNWQYFEVVVDNTFPLAEGLDTPNKNTVPRMPFLYFNVNGNEAGTTYYLDDLTVLEYTGDGTEGAAQYPYPYLSGVGFSAKTYETGEIKTKYTFQSVSGALNGGTLLRLYKKVGDHKVFFTETTEKVITIPVGLAEENVIVELLPVDEYGYVGKPYTKAYDIKPAQKVTAQFSNWNAETNAVEAFVSVADNAPSDAPVSYFAILAVYDESNKLVGFSTKTITAVSVDSEPITVTAPETATTAKLFVWSGNAIDTAGENVYTKVTSFSKE